MIEGILWVLFTLGCIVVSGLVLLQEGKGGGLGEAFGGAGAQTFGVKAQGVAKVTGYMIAGLVLMAIVITKIRSGSSGVEGMLEGAPAGVVPNESSSAPVEPGAGTDPAPADGPEDG
jgi:preprotein translocase subunit SecG